MIQPGGCLRAGKRCEVAQQDRANTLSLVVIDDGKSDFCHSGLFDDIATAGDDRGVVCLFHDRHQCNVIDEINIQKERTLFI